MMNFVQSKYHLIKQRFATQKQFLKENYIEEIAKKARMHARNDFDLESIDLELKMVLISISIKKS